MHLTYRNGNFNESSQRRSTVYQSKMNIPIIFGDVNARIKNTPIPSLMNIFNGNTININRESRINDTRTSLDQEL